jgi:transposase
MFSDFSSPLPNLTCQQVDCFAQRLVVSLVSSATQNQCPLCGQASGRIHSRYQRRLTDLPVAGQNCVWHITACKFFCDNPHCHRRIFTQRFAEHISPHARWIGRCQQQLQQIGLLAGGRLGSTMARLFGLLVSGTMLLRRVRQKTIAVEKAPRVLGVDDWAFPKGKTYGTILVDLEKQCVIDLLPDRETQTLKLWLEQYLGVEVVSRDRAITYALAATLAAPQAVQVADRWHLLKNLGEAIQRVLETHRPAMKQASELVAQVLVESPITHLDAVSSPLQTDSDTHRQQVYQQVKAFQAAGRSKRWVVRKTGLSAHTVRKFWRWTAYQPKASSRYSSIRPYETTCVGGGKKGSIM